MTVSLRLRHGLDENGAVNGPAGGQISLDQPQQHRVDGSLAQTRSSSL